MSDEERSPLSEAQRVRVVALREAADIGRPRGGLVATGTKFSAGELVYLAGYIEHGEADDPE